MPEQYGRIRAYKVLPDGTRAYNRFVKRGANGPEFADDGTKETASTFKAWPGIIETLERRGYTIEPVEATNEH
jgi:hypothetical protein